MTAGERLIQSIALKARFYDAHERRAYGRAVEVARRIVDDPTLLERGRAFLETFVGADPRQAEAYRLWIDTLALGADGVARLLLADDELGAYLRGTAPVFTTISKDVAYGLSHRAS